MRTILLLSALVLTAGSAQASIPSQAATPQRAPVAASLRLCGSVWLQDRPLPGAVLHYPGILSPLRGPHGGLLAQQQRGGRRQG